MKTLILVFLLVSTSAMADDYETRQQQWESEAEAQDAYIQNQQHEYDMQQQIENQQREMDEQTKQYQAETPAAQFADQFGNCVTCR